MKYNIVERKRKYNKLLNGFDIKWSKTNKDKLIYKYWMTGTIEISLDSYIMKDFLNKRFIERLTTILDREIRIDIINNLLE